MKVKEYVKQNIPALQEKTDTELAALLYNVGYCPENYGKNRPPVCRECGPCCDQGLNEEYTNEMCDLIEQIKEQIKPPCETFEKPKNCVFEYFEIRNTVSEYNSAVTARWSSFELALADMPNHEDWWAPKGTGDIYRVVGILNNDGSIKINEKRVRRFH